MNELALFAGAGGGLLATTHLLKWRTVCYVEWDDYCIDVLKQRIADGYLHDAPIWDDVRTFDGHPWAGCVDIVTAGFPCQPFSAAGKQLAEDDKRNMWPDTIRVIRECQPRAVLLENVPGLVSSGYIFVILDDLAQAGYKALPPVRLAASDVGANHKRERVWIVAYTQQCSGGCENISCQTGRENPQRSAGRTSRSGDGGGAEAVAYSTSTNARSGAEQLKGTESFDQESPFVLSDPSSGGRETKAGDHNGANAAYAQGQPIGAGLCPGEPAKQRGRRSGDGCGSVSITKQPGLAQWEGLEIGSMREPKIPAIARGDWWTTEPALGRVDNGVAHRVDRLKAIGNGQVPAVVSTVWQLLTDDLFTMEKD